MIKSILTKSFAFAMLLLFVSAHGFAQQIPAKENPEKLLLLEKAEKFHRMKNTGTTLTVVGSLLSVVGIAVLVNSSETTTYNGTSTQTTTDGNPVAGAAAYLIGTACVGAGIPLWIVGGVNEGKYRRKFDAFTVGTKLSPQYAGVTLRLKF